VGRLRQGRKMLSRQWRKEKDRRGALVEKEED